MYEGDSDGQPLVEVFSVRLHSGVAPTGTVSVFDGKRGQIIYRRTQEEEPHKPAASSRHRSSGELPLTGPYRAVSADGCVAIVFDLQGRCQNKAAASSSPSSSSSSYVLDLQGHCQNKAAASSSSCSSYVAEILLDVYDEKTRYDEAITHDDGFVQVRYALLSDAAEAIVEVRLLRPGAGGKLHGTVVARTDVGEVVLFDDVGETAMSIDTQELTGILPLARSVVAVLVTSSLTIDVDLVFNGGGTVKESAVSAPKPGGGKEVCRHEGGEVEVTVTWLD